MRWLTFPLLLALALWMVLSPGALAHELSLAEVTELAEAASADAAAARGLAQMALGAGLTGLAAALVSLVVNLRRR